MEDEPQYAGFWVRVAASVIDSILLIALIGPLMAIIYGPEVWLEPNQSQGGGLLGGVINYLLPALAVLVFWYYKSATPGKMAFGLTIVDAKTGGKPGTGQLIGRYLCYYVSMLPLVLGIVWVGIDKRKQGFHDKLAGTLVIKRR